MSFATVKIVSHTLVLDIPDEAYEELVHSANQKGQPPEKSAVAMVLICSIFPVNC